MEKRIRIGKLQPAAYKAMMAMEAYIDQTALEPLHKELIRIRASQVNGCAYCLDMHTKDARKLGETEQKLYLIAAWREAAGVFSEEERAILALTEEITLIQHHVSDATYQKALSLFGEVKLAQLIMMIISINMWNRVGVSQQMLPGE